MNSTSNPLTNVLTPKVRAILYAVLFVGALLFAAWQAADGDWLQFVGGIITSLLGATAASNASWTPVEDHGPLPDDEDGWDEGEDPEDEGLWDLPTDTIHGGTGSSHPDSGNFRESNDYGYQPPA